MGSYMVGTWLYAILSVIIIGGWSIYSLTAEGWMSSRGKPEKALRIIVWLGLTYQILLPFYWCYVTAPKGIGNLF